MCLFQGLIDPIACAAASKKYGPPVFFQAGVCTFDWSVVDARLWHRAESRQGRPMLFLLEASQSNRTVKFHNSYAE